MKTLVGTMGMVLLSPALVSAMTIECRDLTFGRALYTLSVELDQGRATIPSTTGRLLGRYSFEVLGQNADSVVLLGRQSALPWPSPALLVIVDLEGAKAREQPENPIESYRIAGAIEWACRHLK